MSRTVFLCTLAVLGSSALAAGGPTPPAAARAEGANFEVVLEPPATAQAGKPAAAQVVVRARGKLHVNKDYPMGFDPAPEATAWPTKARIPLGQGAEKTPCAGEPGESCAVKAPLAFTPAAAGPVTLAGTVRFSVCSADRCLIEKQPLALTVTVR